MSDHKKVLEEINSNLTSAKIKLGSLESSLESKQEELSELEEKIKEVFGTSDTKKLEKVKENLIKEANEIIESLRELGVTDLEEINV